MFPILLRTLILYFTLVLSIRLTGKRQVGELQLSELTTAFLISEVAAAPLSDPDIPLIHAILPILALVCLEILVSYLITKLPFLKRLLEPSPTILIDRGKLNLHAMQKQRLTADELLSALRQKDVADLSQLEYCFLEQNGQISAFEKQDALTLPVVVDGRIYQHFLTLLSRDEAWLRARLVADKRRLSELFLALSDGNTVKYYERKQV
ncbi:MAG: DUF421 domain-containing protein [Ruminococcaceae bacterium]|nr:DUF421 domain-containing protein [Oscillospiraceae bacterium]